MPKSPVVDSQVINSSTILLKWKAVKKFLQPITAYNLHYNENQEENDHSIEIAAENNTDDYEYRLTNLNQMTTYSISVSSTSKFGEGPRSTPVLEQTSAIGEG